METDGKEKKLRGPRKHVKFQETREVQGSPKYERWSEDHPKFTRDGEKTEHRLANPDAIGEEDKAVDNVGKDSKDFYPYEVGSLADEHAKEVLRIHEKRSKMKCFWEK